MKQQEDTTDYCLFPHLEDKPDVNRLEAGNRLSIREWMKETK